MASYRLNKAVLNEILRVLYARGKPLNIALYLKNIIGITPEILLSEYQKELRAKEYVTIQKTLLSNLATITEKGRHFIRSGGYVTHTPKNKMSEDEFKNFVLKEMLHSEEGKNLQEIAANLRVDKSLLDIDNIEGKLYSLGYVTISKSPSIGNILKLTDTGKEFIEDGGFTNDLGIRALRLIKKDSRKTKVNAVKDYPLIGNKEQLNYATEELVDIEDRLDKIKNAMEISELRVLQQKLKIILQKVFPKDHEIYFLKSELDKNSQLTICSSAMYNIEFELLNSHSNFTHIHPIIENVSHELYKNGHYREAVSNAFSQVIEEIKNKFNIKTKDNKLMDGRPLMEHVFTKDYIFKDLPEDYKEGIKLLYCGAVSALRNKYVHRTAKIHDPEYAMNLLHYASALIRLLETPNVY